MFRRSPQILVALAVVLLAAPSAQADRSTTHLLSLTPAGTLPNGPSFDPAISKDRQVATLAAFDSFATDLVPGDVNGDRDVFVVHRGQPFDPNAKVGTPWIPGQTDLVSIGMGGQPANGDSWAPNLDGDQRHSPHCVAFLSAATNLVPNDTNGRVDAFVKDLATGQITDVSLNSQGLQANGDTFDVKIDGACDRVAFTSDATNLALTVAPKPIALKACPSAKRHGKGKKRKKKKPACRPRRVPSLAAAGLTTAPQPGTKQVYVRVLGASQADDAGLAGVTFLASASAGGQAGNGNSYDVSFSKLSAGCPAHCGSQSGDAVAFTSEATNLAPGDGNGLRDVYERSFSVPTLTYLQVRAGVQARMQMKTRLVSATRDGQAGNGASDQPSVDDAGDLVAYRTAATNLLSGDTNGVTDVALAHMTSDPPTQEWVSRTAPTNAIGNAPSSNPDVSRPGSPLVFQTDADNLTTSDWNCVSDILFWNFLDHRAVLTSSDSNARPSGNTAAGLVCPAHHTSPATHPATSYYANYTAFEDGNPLIDLPVADASFPGLRYDLDRAYQMATSDPNLHQVYIHYTSTSK